MAIVKPFCAVRASRDKVALVSSRSYEAYSPAELGAQLDFNPFSFLHIISPSYKHHEEISSEQRFQLIHDKYIEFKELNHFSKDTTPSFYIYKKTTRNFSCCGIIAATSTQDYVNNIIKKHEETLHKREVLFEKYLKTTGFNAEPVLLTYPDNLKIASVLKKYQKTRAEYEFTTENYKTHYLWKVDSPDDILIIQDEFTKMNALYIADGHHRTASSYLLSEDLKRKNTNHNGNEDYNFFMSYLIPESELQISEYNRLVKDLNGLTKEQLLEKLSVLYTIQNRGSQFYKPSKKHHFSMYLDGEFYSLYLKKEEFEIDNPLSDLDPQLLYKTILKPIFGINDLRNDKRLSYSHSEQGEINLKNSVDSGKFAVAFGLVPISVAQLKAVADADLKMPPKSTYILPKLRSGLTIYEF
ncbi:MAG: DUF1015 domain-containing protein [Flavobacteriaceae bacterium]|nr:DUF1015 domain-containing protein [Flavobacteriaceae bacterium]